MAASVTILGVRHHGPGSARMVVHALNALRPDAVLIEGPPDAADVVALAGHVDMKPPVALLVYEPDCPSEAGFYPFAEFSPEWQALRWAAATGAEARFIDLPHALRPRHESAGLDQDESGVDEHDATDEGSDSHEAAPAERGLDPLEGLARAAGYADGEAWWGRLIEERRGEEDPLGVFGAICEAMESVRASLGVGTRDPLEAPREAHMRRSIRAAIKQGFGTIAVVCGAWHAPVLTSEALRRIKASEDDAALKGLSKRKTAATWIPWTNDRLSRFSGYGAGIVSPGWYEHLWTCSGNVAEGWLARVARLMRLEGLDASPASVVEAVRLTETLASLRGRSTPGLDDLTEATLAVLCHGDGTPLRVIERQLIVGLRIGETPAEAPVVPLQRDIAALQKSLRLKVVADDVMLELDQRKELDLARSRFLHRLAALGIHWGKVADEPQQRTSTFREVWTLQWKPELSIAIMEAARWGNTVLEAAEARVADRAANALDLGELAEMLDHVLLADLARVVASLVARIQQVSAVSADVGRLMEAIPPLARVIRYGNVRKTDAALVEPVVEGMVARVCAGLLPACGSLDDDAARVMKGRVDGVHAALASLEREDLHTAWTTELRRVGDAGVHGLVAGRCWRLLLDGGETDSEEAGNRLHLALSPGNGPVEAAAWIEGFLGGSGLLLVHDAALLGVIDAWVTSLSRETFERVCPIVRRAFATFSKPERRSIGESIKRGGTGARPARRVESDDYDAERGELVEPVLRLILGEVAP